MTRQEMLEAADKILISGIFNIEQAVDYAVRAIAYSSMVGRPFKLFRREGTYVLKTFGVESTYINIDNPDESITQQWGADEPYLIDVSEADPFIDVYLGANIQSYRAFAMIYKDLDVDDANAVAEYADAHNGQTDISNISVYNRFRSKIRSWVDIELIEKAEVFKFSANPVTFERAIEMFQSRFHTETIDMITAAQAALTNNPSTE